MVLSVVFTMGLGLSLTLNPNVLPWYGIALAVLACAAVPYLLHSLPNYDFSGYRLILPAALALASPQVAHALSVGPFRLLGVFAPGALLYGLILAESFLIRNSEDETGQAARLLLTIGAYTVALVVFLLLYAGKERALISSTVAVLLGAGVSLRLYVLDGVERGRALASAVVTGVVVGEVLWPLNYWLLGITAGGIALLLCLYVLVGILRQIQAGHLTQAEVLEWVTVSAAGLAVVFGASRI